MFGEPAADRRVIGRRAGISRPGQAAAHVGDHGGVILRVGYDGDAFMVFRGRADHGRAADIDIFDACFVIRTCGDGCFERVKVHHQQVDRTDIVFFHCRHVPGIAATRKNTAVNFRVQRFYATVHHFGKAGMVGNVDHIDPGIAHRPGGAAGGQDLNPLAGKKFRQFHESGFIGNGNQSPPDGGGSIGHRKASVADADSAGRRL